MRQQGATTSKGVLRTPLLAGHRCVSVPSYDGSTSEMLWSALDDMDKESDWTLPEHVNPTRVIEKVLQSKYKDRDVHGCVLFAAIEYCAHIREHKGSPQGMRMVPRTDADIPLIIHGVLAARADVDSPATHSEGAMRAIHYASGRGLVPVLQALLKEKLSGESEEDRAAVQVAALNVFTTNEQGEENYSPIHDAVWFKQQEATAWLLNNKADPDARNLLGCTPMHILASGSSAAIVELLLEANANLSLCNRSGENPLEVAVSRPFFPVSKLHMLARSCIGENSSFLSYLRDIYDLAVENQEAAEEFVEVLLGHHTVEVARNDRREDSNSEDTDSEDDPERGLRLKTFVRSVDTATAREAHATEETLVMMAAVMEKAPRAAALILDVLVGDPVVQDNEHHPLPCRANMIIDGFEESMICDYQPDSCEVHGSEGDGFIPWRQQGNVSRSNLRTKTLNEDAPQRPSLKRNSRGADKWKTLRRSIFRQVVVAHKLQQGVIKRSKCRLPCWKFSSLSLRAPAWHEHIAPLPKNLNNDRQVRIQVLKMADLLDVRIVHVLANTQHLHLFAEKTVQGIVNCLWHRLIKHSVCMSQLLDLVNLAALLLWIAMGELAPGQKVPLQRTCWLITLSTGVRELVNLACVLRMRNRFGRPMLSYIQSAEVLWGLALTVLLIFLAWYSHGSYQVPQVGWGRSVLALNFFLRWTKITYNCRSTPKVGPKLVCVLKSFMPMKEMMFITVVVFFGFAAAATLIKDGPNGNCEDHCTVGVIMALFKALLLGDGDGFEDLTHLPGADPSGIFAGVLVVVATVVFTICILNLLIAVYSNEYDRKEKQEELLFVQERAKICLTHLMEPMWPRWQVEPEWFWRWWGRHKQSMPAEHFVRLAVTACAVVLVTSGMLLAELFDLELLPLVVFTATLLLLQVASKRCDWEHPRRADGRDHFYLWICSRASFNKHQFRENTVEDANSKIEDMHETLRGVVQLLDKQMTELRKDVQAMRGEVSSELKQRRSDRRYIHVPPWEGPYREHSRASKEDHPRQGQRERPSLDGRDEQPQLFGEVTHLGAFRGPPGRCAECMRPGAQAGEPPKCCSPFMAYLKEPAQFCGTNTSWAVHEEL